MYNVFDDFLNEDSWWSWHFCDMDRFYVALAKIVDHPEFQAHGVGDYIRAKKPGEREETVERLTECAATIRRYLDIQETDEVRRFRSANRL